MNLVSSGMQIQQKSYCTFLVKFKNGEVLVNPSTSQKGDVNIYSLNNSPYLKYESGDETVTVNAAGEYEAKDVFINGRKALGEEGVAYTFSCENITVGVVSFITKYDDLPVDLFEDVDILIIGGAGGMNMTPKDAHELLQKVTPKVCIIHGFEEQGSKDVKSALLPLEDVKKEITALLPMPEKTYKVTKEELDRIENTEVYYFEL